MWRRLYTPLRRAYLQMIIGSIQRSIEYLDAEAQQLPETRQHYQDAHTHRRRQLQALEAQVYRLPRPIPTVSWGRWPARVSQAWQRAHTWLCARSPVRG